MKIGELKSLGHNIADSLGSGIGMLIGVYEMNVYAEAAASDAGYIKVDFLNATTTGSATSADLSRAIGLYREKLPNLCAKHGINPSEIKTLEARFGTDPAYGPHFAVTVESVDGKSSTDQYVGIPRRKLRHVHAARACGGRALLDSGQYLGRDEFQQHVQQGDQALAVGVQEDGAWRKLCEQIEQLVAAHTGPHQHRFAGGVDPM